MSKNRKSNLYVTFILAVFLVSGIGAYKYFTYKNYQKLTSKTNSESNYTKKVSKDNECKYEDVKDKNLHKIDKNKTEKIDKNINKTNDEAKINYEDKTKKHLNIDEDEAINLVKHKVFKESVNPNLKFRIDRQEIREEIQYFVIQVYGNMGGSTQTQGWYFVDKNTGEVYLWDLMGDALEKL